MTRNLFAMSCIYIYIYKANTPIFLINCYNKWRRDVDFNTSVSYKNCRHKFFFFFLGCGNLNTSSHCYFTWRELHKNTELESSIQFIKHLQRMSKFVHQHRRTVYAMARWPIYVILALLLWLEIIETLKRNKRKRENDW